jgi:hypothetical protein
MWQDAVIGKLEIIGEAVKRISEATYGELWNAIFNRSTRRSISCWAVRTRKTSNAICRNNPLPIAAALQLVCEPLTFAGLIAAGSIRRAVSPRRGLPRLKH